MLQACFSGRWVIFQFGVCVCVLTSAAMQREDLTRSGPAKTYSMPGRSVAAAWDMKGSCKDATRLGKPLGVIQHNIRKEIRLIVGREARASLA